MAAIPTSLAEAVRRSSSSSCQASTSFGRGGAGNVRPAYSIDNELVDLNTPTIKSNYYTTGRGGSGNMAKNTDPDQARRAQDIVARPHPKPDSKTHVGRGGAANISTPSQDEIAAVKRDNERYKSTITEEKTGARNKGLADKGKEWLFGVREGRMSASS